MKEDARDPSLERRLERLERQLEDVASTLEQLKSRFSVLEGRDREPLDLPPSGEAVEPSLSIELPQTGSFLNLLTQVGRSSLILGGAFLVRSLTDGGILARPAGVAFGLAYACFWILIADQSAKKGRRSSAAYLGITGVIIAYPLIGETSTRWPVFTPVGAAVAVTAVTALCLAIAWLRNLPVLSWAAAGAAVLTAFALSLLTGAVEPFAAGLLAIGIVGAWFAYGHRHWHVLRWPLAVAADVLVLWSALRLLPSEAPAAEPRSAITPFLWLAFALPFLYLVSFGLRTLARRRDVTAFEVLQTMAALAIGFGGAAAVARQVPAALPMLGASALVIGGGCYAVAFVFVERQQGRGRNFTFYAGLALLLTLSGSALVGGGALLGLFWCALALASALLATRFARLTLAVHSSAYALAAAWQTGLLRASVDAFGAPATRAFSPETATGLVTIAIAGACYVLLARDKERTAAPGARFPRSVLVVLVVAGCGALVIEVFRKAAGGQPPGSDPGGIAALRTAVLAAAAFLFAGARRRTALPELAALAYAILALATVKLLFEDLPQGRASTLFVGFVFYGLALLVTPRLLRGASAPREQ